MRLETPRLVLLNVQFTDANDLFQAAKESLADLGKVHPWAKAQYSMRDTQTHVQESIANDREGKGSTFIIRGKAGRLFGEVTLVPEVDPFGQPPHAYTLHFWMRSSEVVNDFTAEALAGITTHILTTLKGKRVSVQVSSLDKTSPMALEKAGFQKEAVLKHTRRLPDETYADTLIYARLA